MQTRKHCGGVWQGPTVKTQYCAQVVLRCIGARKYSAYISTSTAQARGRMQCSSRASINRKAWPETIAASKRYLEYQLAIGEAPVLVAGLGDALRTVEHGGFTKAGKAYHRV